MLHYRYRTGARAIFAQERGYGEGEVVLYRKFHGDGMRRRSLAQVAASLARLMFALPRVRTEAGRARVATMAGILSRSARSQPEVPGPLSLTGLCL